MTWHQEDGKAEQYYILRDKVGTTHHLRTSYCSQSHTGMTPSRVLAWGTVRYHQLKVALTPRTTGTKSTVREHAPHPVRQLPAKPIPNEPHCPASNGVPAVSHTPTIYLSRLSFDLVFNVPHIMPHTMTAPPCLLLAVTSHTNKYPRGRCPHPASSPVDPVPAKPSLSTDIYIYKSD